MKFTLPVSFDFEPTNQEVETVQKSIAIETLEKRVESYKSKLVLLVGLWTSLWKPKNENNIFI